MRNPGSLRPAEGMSRRRVLTRIAGAAATIPFAHALAQAESLTARRRPSPPPDGQPIRVGVIGTGGMGTGHARALVELAREGHEHVEVALLCDVCTPRLEAARAECLAAGAPDIPVTMRFADVLSNPAIHAVLIATPEHWHAEMAVQAILAGKDVYLEKPMTLRLDEALRLLDAARSNPGVMVQVGTQLVQHPKYQIARRWIRDGLIGKPTLSQASYCRNSREGEWQYYDIDPSWRPGENVDWDGWCGPLAPQPWDPHVFARWRRYRRWSTGIVGDLLVHQITPLMIALDVGWPTRVVASGGHYVDTAMENHDTVSITIEFERGHTMIVAGSTANAVGLDPLIRGHRGTISLAGDQCALAPERIYRDEVQPLTESCPLSLNDQHLHRLEWLRSVRTRRAPSSGVDLGAMVMVIVDLATRSMWDGRAYRFNPDSLSASAI